MRKIVVLSKSTSDASTRYRAEQYRQHFLHAGYEIQNISISGGLLAFIKGMVKAYQADTVIVLRKTFPSLQLLLLRYFASKLIYDFDDSIFCRSDGSESQTRYNRFKKIARVADVIFAGNHFLAGHARQMNNNVVVIPTSVDTGHYASKEVDKISNYIDLVWIGSQSTSKYLKEILPIIEKSYTTHPKLRLKVIADFELKDTKIPVESVRWTKEIEVQALKSAHIGIAPMTNNAWTQGKCALKVLQYMASKLPVITVDVGVNGDAIIDGQSGFLVSDEASWLKAIDKLYHDVKLRVRMGEVGSMMVKENYDTNVTAKKILHSLNTLNNEY